MSSSAEISNNTTRYRGVHFRESIVQITKADFIVNWVFLDDLVGIQVLMYGFW